MIERNTISYDELHRILNYNPDTGIFIWKQSERQYWISKQAGCLNKSNGYIQIKINKQIFYAHRLAWLYIYGYLPEHQVDHIDQVKTHNWIKNLREATQYCNMQNCKLGINNKSGITGVCWNKRCKKWYAQIFKNHKQIYLGSFDNLYDAAKARYKAEQEYFDCVVKSSAKKYIEQYKGR